VIEHPSPNHEPRPTGMPVDMLVLHYTGMRTAAEALARMCDPTAKVSAHYMIDEVGGVYRLVDEERRAWHAGTAEWRGLRDINGRSVGIELVNPGHQFGYRLFPDAQMATLEILAHDILRRHPIPPRNVVGHSDVAPSRKQDPGELFDWQWLARSGIGLWPGWTPPPARDVATVQHLLERYGYAVPRSGELDRDTARVVEAFQRHFRPERVDGIIDRETAGRLSALLALAEADEAEPEPEDRDAASLTAETAADA
jgi:N-acetylmuramoyl-L-alanine amidase